MTNRERFRRVLNFEPVDRLPVTEWAGWWSQTLDRWRGEGLPHDLQDSAAIRDYLGLDSHYQQWVSPRATSCPKPPAYGKGLIRNRAEYRSLKRHLFPKSNPAAEERLAAWAARQATGESAIWISLDGFFWFPRTILGIEPHLYAFDDQPDLPREINEDLLEFHLDVLDRVCAICTPEFMTFAEDMSYNHGPMLSERMFEEFLAPWYRRLVPELHRRGIVPIVDTDGDVTTAIPWYLDVGIAGFLPLERMAGVDIAAIRGNHPRLRLVGAFDKTVMHRGEGRVREEFERLLPVMRQGGYIPGVDHQTPPEVSLKQYRDYIGLLREYCERAGEMRQG